MFVFVLITERSLVEIFFVASSGRPRVSGFARGFATRINIPPASVTDAGVNLKIDQATSILDWGTSHSIHSFLLLSPSLVLVY